MLNSINNIYTTISDGQTHIAADTKYIGTVSSYNNSISKFFASLFGLSVNVNFDGKIRSLNKESYKYLLHNLTQNKTTTIGQHTLFRSVAENVALPVNNLKMRDVISSTDKHSLFRKLAQAISRGETQRALMLIGKGAEVDNEYFDRSPISPSFYRDSDGLSSESKYQFTVFKAPPIVQAVKKANRAVVDFLKEAGADTNRVGNEYGFQREITSVDHIPVIVYEPHFIHHTHLHNRYHGHSRHGYTQVHYTPELRERTVVNTRDFRTNELNYKLDSDLNLVSL
jgi:hypothetical protein